MLVAGLGLLPGVAGATITIPTETPPPPAITLHASRTTLTGSRFITLTGRVSNAPVGSVVSLSASPFPYRTAHVLRTRAPAADGTFSFTPRPDRDTRYRVDLTGTTAHVSVQILVIGHFRTGVRALPLGQAEVKVIVFHPKDLRWNGARVSWWFAAGFRGPFGAIRATRTRRINAYATEFSTIVSGPAGHFRWRACFRAGDEHALFVQKGFRGCAGRAYSGLGFLPVGYPSPDGVARAARYLGGRAGRTAFAVIDSEGRMSGVHEHWTFVSASVVKAMLLVAYLRRLGSLGRQHVDSFSNSFLYPMINVSDNAAATQTWSIVGDAALYRLAHRAGMTDFSIVGIWANAQISPADQAKFFFNMDSLIPPQFVGYARYLLSTIAGFESWGIPAVARPRGYAVFFKGGWRGTGLGQLVHQVARLEGHGRRFSIAVMTDGDPSMGYGIGTIQGVTGSLL
jgi:Beta-lactamase enzyme family